MASRDLGWPSALLMGALEPARHARLAFAVSFAELPLEIRLLAWAFPNRTRDGARKGGPAKADRQPYLILTQIV